MRGAAPQFRSSPSRPRRPSLPDVASRRGTGLGGPPRAHLLRGLRSGRDHRPASGGGSPAGGRPAPGGPHHRTFNASPGARVCGQINTGIAPRRVGAPARVPPLSNVELKGTCRELRFGVVADDPSQRRRSSRALGSGQERVLCELPRGRLLIDRLCDIFRARESAGVLSVTTILKTRAQNQRPTTGMSDVCVTLGG